jgi:hypothetical protein
MSADRGSTRRSAVRPGVVSDSWKASADHCHVGGDSLVEPLGEEAVLHRDLYEIGRAISARVLPLLVGAARLQRVDSNALPASVMA